MEVKKKKERIFYLDFIRALSIIIIVTYHFAVSFGGEHSSAPYITFLQKGQFGIFGVALFFMISGASLMYNYGEKIDLKTYYKKRFLGIYPAYWICYSLVFLFSFWKNKALVWNGPFINIIFSVLGMDGYLIPYFNTFRLIGDWFVGCIVLIYILFPLYKSAMERFPKIFFGLFTILYLIIIFFSHFKMPLNNDLLVSSYSFLLGMYYMKYLKKIKIWHVIISLIVSIICFNIANTMEMWKGVLFGNLVGYNLFIVLSYLGSKIKCSSFKDFIIIISKYSYFIFLIHHYVIYQMSLHYYNVTLDQYGTIIVYIMTWVIIALLSKILYSLNKKSIAYFANKEK